MFKEIEPLADNEIIVNSIPRSGSTVCDQIVQELGFEVRREHNALLVQTCYEQKIPMIVTMRDPVDIVLSARRLVEHSHGKTYGFTLHVMREWHKRRNERYAENDHYLMVRYEKYMHDPKQRIRDIARFLGVDCSERKVEEIHSNTSIERNKKIASKYENFDQHCKGSLIHGGHISEDPYGENRDLSVIDASTWATIRECRRKWGYE